MMGKIRQPVGRPKSVTELTREHWMSLGNRAKQMWVERGFRYWRQQGFPQHDISKIEIKSEFDKLSSVPPDKIIVGSELRASTYGLRLANFFHPYMWEIPASRYRTPMDVYRDDKLLRACIGKSLRICKDRPPLSANSMRRMLISFSNTASVSNFRPAVAKALIDAHSEPGCTVLDYCAGFGGRLLGTLAAERHYVGIDVSRRTCSALRRMERVLRETCVLRSSVQIKRGRAEEIMKQFEARSFGLVLTSPPYYARERYDRDPEQSYLRYPSYAEWRRKFLKRTIQESKRVLVKGGIYMLNISDWNGYPLEKDALTIARQELTYVRTYRLRIPLLPYQRRNGDDIYKYEPVFVFRK